MRWVLALAMLFAGSSIMAQEVAVTPAPGVFVVDTDRLYAESETGRRIRKGLDDAGAALQAENVRIQEELTAEEQDLAQRRPDMEVAEFRAEAETFHQKVEAIRAERDEKNNAFNQSRADAQNLFFDQLQDLVGQVMIERGGAVVLSSRSVFLFRRSADITDVLIERLDAQLDPVAPEN